MIALHGNGDTNANFVATAKLESLATSEGFVLAAPQGIAQQLTAALRAQNLDEADKLRKQISSEKARLEEALGTLEAAERSAFPARRAEAAALAAGYAVQRLVGGDWRQPGWVERLAGPFDLLVSNPPYIATGALQTAAVIIIPQYRDYPDLIANLLTNAAKYTEPGGRVALRARAEERAPRYTGS